jgi:GT2 family glycosyltransferase
MINPPKVYIVILNYIKWQDALQCISSLLTSTYSDFTIFLVDNCSDNDSIKHLSESVEKNYNGQITQTIIEKKDLANIDNAFDLPKITFIQNDENAGFAGGNNLALNLVKNENAFVWLLNPDMIVKDNTMELLVEYASLQSRRAIIGTEVRKSGSEEVFFIGGSKLDFNKAKPLFNTDPNAAASLDFISGASLFTHLSNFKELGLLPEHYFLFWEETDWCYNAKLNGHPLLICPDAICYDKVSSVIGKGFLSDYYYVRNGLYFTAKFHKSKVPFVFSFMAVRWVKRILTMQFDRAKGVYKGAVDFSRGKHGMGH